MLVDLKPYGGTYIHSLSEPFNEEMEISFERMHNWLKHFNLRFVQSHCSGHISGSDLKDMIKTINPKSLFPIHTEYPEMFKKINKNPILVKDGKKYKL
jgi:ribonuclease J